MKIGTVINQGLRQVLDHRLRQDVGLKSTRYQDQVPVHRLGLDQVLGQGLDHGLRQKPGLQKV